MRHEPWATASAPLDIWRSDDATTANTRLTKKRRMTNAPTQMQLPRFRHAKCTTERSGPGSAHSKNLFSRSFRPSPYVPLESGVRLLRAAATARAEVDLEGATLLQTATAPSALHAVGSATGRHAQRILLNSKPNGRARHPLLLRSAWHHFGTQNSVPLIRCQTATQTPSAALTADRHSGAPWQSLPWPYRSC